jgi:hypothetical protein
VVENGAVRFLAGGDLHPREETLQTVGAGCREEAVERVHALRLGFPRLGQDFPEYGILGVFGVPLHLGEEGATGRGI